MADVIFYGLADCPANAKQKQQLLAAGHSLTERDLATAPLTAAELRAFFGDKEPDQWFNRRAAAIKSGAVKPAALDEAGALAALLADRDLIRRPLIQSGERREAGFDPNTLHAWIGLTSAESCDDKHARGQCDHGHQHFVKPPVAA
ncbi:ArsC/Spx/MgsR family protein [Azospirillum agricola]|uniref:ArsC/Spx/MgsR family protein n=1 Tax=Azospirillum agricola TaxID=1720247 RepID=UPI000A0F0F12|nr:ArsC/Spx/MgsR family protein [Azospirillum agricola]MBP2227559.1 nitrogenase-associated protein [Azospirillum agricola]SMH59438.1 nitrogenase-associated protein [Azospirillum lipoferum]